MPHSPPQTAPRPKKLPARPHLGYLKKLAKERLAALRADRPATKLAQAQLAVAREHGFESWRKLKGHIDQLLFQCALDDGDAPAMSALLRQNPALGQTAEALWTHPKGDRRSAPVLWTAACKRKNLELTRALLDAGANPNNPAVYPDGGPDILRLLLDRGMNPNAMTYPENSTGLMYAAFIDDVENTKLLLARGADPNIALPNCGTRALHKLPWRGETKNPNKTVEVARLLIEAGADVNARIFSGLNDEPITDNGNLYLVEHGGSTLLHTASERGMPALVRFLLANGANVNQRTQSMLLSKSHPADPRRWTYERLNPGLTPLHLAADGRNAQLSTGHTEAAAELLRYGADVDAAGETGNIGVCTPLHFACFSGANRAPLVRLLLDHGANPNVTSSAGTTPLFDAARHGATEIARMLLSAGAKLSIFDAVAMGDFNTVQQMIADDSAAIDRVHPYTRTRPIAFARTAHMREFLLSYGAKPTIHEAAEMGWIDEVRRQLNADPSLVQARSPRGQTALHHAIDWNRLPIAELLIAAGSDLDAKWEPGPGWTPQELAMRRNQPEMIQLLQNAAAHRQSSNPQKAESTREPQQTEKTASQMENIMKFADAIRTGDAATIQNMLRADPALANIDTGNGESSLHLAAEHNHPAIVAILLAAGANLSAKYGRSAHTPLSWAVTVGSFQAADALVQGGAKADLFCAAGMGDVAAVRSFFTEAGLFIPGASKTGSSRYDYAGNILPCPPPTDVEIISDALYAAARNGRANVVKELLAHGPDLAFRAYMGGTPLHWANFSASRETINLLLAAGADSTLLDHVFKCTPRAFGICVPASWGIAHLVRRQLDQDPSLANILEGRGTPLHEAARTGNTAIGKLLLEAGANASILDNEGKTPLDIAKSAGHQEFVQLLTGVSPATSASSPLDAFLDAAVPRPDSNHNGGSLEPARKMLGENPRIAQSSIFAACVCGDVKAVTHSLSSDPSLATTPGGARNWFPLCYLTFSRFLRDEKRRTPDFVKCAKLLLAAGADPNSSWPAPNDPTYRESALYGAAGIANCAPLTKLLIDAGADANDDEALYHASEFKDNAALRVLLQAKPKPEWVNYNLCHKMDMEDPAGVKLFIKHGADVNVLLARGLFKGSRPLHFAIYRRRSLTIFRILLAAGADPNLPDDKGISPYQLARKLGLIPVAKLLKSKGAIDNLDPHTQFLSALSSGDRKTAQSMLRRNPALKTEISEQDHKLLVNAAEAGNTSAVRLMLDTGFPISTRGTPYGGWDATALDQSAWHGHAPIVRLLLKRGADPTVKHSYGGDALGAAIHGANHAHHTRGLSAIKALAVVATTSRLERAIEYAKTEPNQKLTAMLESLLNERGANERSKS